MGAGSNGGTAPRRIAGKAVRRVERRLHAWQTSLLGDDAAPAPRPRETAAQDRTTDPAALLARLGRVVAQAEELDAKAFGGRRPDRAQADALVRVLERWAAEHDVLAGVVRGDGVARSMVATARRLVRLGEVARVRALGSALLAEDGSREVGALVSAVAATADRAWPKAWDLFGGVDRSLALSSAPAELFRAGFAVDVEEATALLSDALRDDLVEADPAQWFEIAGMGLAVGAEPESRHALLHARTLAEAEGRTRLLERIEWLESWYGTTAAATRDIAVPRGAVPFAVLDYKQPDEAYASKNLGDHVQTIASLGHLVRRSGVSFTGDADLVELASSLQRRVKPARVVDGDDAVVELHLVQRDASHHDLVPDGTWALAFGWYMHPQFGVAFDMPFNPRIRPIFVSFHVNAPAFLTDDVLAYLRRHAPVGCRDWNTVHLLLAAGVPAFFSGCLTTTVDTVFPEGRGEGRTGTLYVDTPRTGPGTHWRQTAPEIRRRSFTENVADALDVLESYRSTYQTVVTSRLHCYLPARSLGAEVEFRARNVADVRFDGLIGIDDAAYERIRQGMLARLEPVMGAIVAGASEDDVYALWREVNAADVALAEERHRASVEVPEPSFDLDAAVQALRGRTVPTVPDAERSDATTVAVSVVGDEVGRLAVLLESLVAHAGGPLHVHVVSESLPSGSWDRLVAAFPDVALQHWPTDGVDLGTADRRDVQTLLVAELLPDVERVVVLDPSVLVLGDVAELAAVDLQGHALAARTAPHPDAASGFARAIRASSRMATDGLARELVRLTHARHDFDYPALQDGVLVLDVERLRRDQVARTFVPWLERYGLGAGDVLDVHVGPHRAELDRRWNQRDLQEVLDDPKSIGWDGPGPDGPVRVDGRAHWRRSADRAAARLGRAGERADEADPR